MFRAFDEPSTKAVSASSGESRPSSARVPSACGRAGLAARFVAASISAAFAREARHLLTCRSERPKAESGGRMALEIKSIASLVGAPVLYVCG
jgi:hypothetical protein